MKKRLCMILVFIMVLTYSVPSFGAVGAYRRSKNVSSESEQYLKGVEEWLKANGSWLISDDIYFARHGSKYLEHAVSFNSAERSIYTDRKKKYDMNYNNLLMDWSDTHFFKKTREKDGYLWTMTEWPKIVISRDRVQDSDEYGPYYYFVYYYEFEEGL